MRNSASGFSLVEMMVALLVMSLFAGVALLMAPGPDQSVRATAQTLAARMQAASAESTLINRRIALIVTPDGYGFERLDETGWRAVPGARAFAFSAWPQNVEPAIRTDAEGKAIVRAAQFDPVTGAAPARVVLKGERTSWVVGVDAEGEIHVGPAS